MTFNFNVTLYLTKHTCYYFSYPLGTDKHPYQLQKKLGLGDDDYATWKPEFERLPVYEKDKFLTVINDHDFAYMSETHPCREIAVAKGLYYARWLTNMQPLYQFGYITLTYPQNIPKPFKAVVTQGLLKPANANRQHGNKSIVVDLDSPSFVVAMNPTYWNNAWISMLTYFAKYGNFLHHLAMDKYGTKDEYNLAETVHLIMDSWSDQVGLYTAFGLWKWANKDQGAITFNTSMFTGIHSAMVAYTRWLNPNALIEFLQLFDLNLDRVDHGFIANYQERLEAAGFELPYSYANNMGNSVNLAESPEWSDYMGYTDEDDDDDYDEDYDEDYDDDDDYDFEEDW